MNLSRRPIRAPRWVSGLLFLLVASAAVAARAQAPPDTVAIQAAAVDQVRDDLKPIVQASLAPRVDETTLKSRLAEIAPIRARLSAAITALTPKLADLDARLAQLGPAPGAGQPPESAQTAATRANLLSFRLRIDGELKQARLLAVESDQAARGISERLRGAFTARLWTRAPSILDPGLWTAAADAMPAEVARLRESAGAAPARSAPARGAGRMAILSAAAVVALFLLGPIRWGLGRLARRRIEGREPESRLRRTGFALWRVFAAVTAPLAAALVLRAGLAVTGAVTAPVLALADAAIRALVFGALIEGLGAALLAPGRPAWRLAPVSDRAARRLAPFPVVIGAAAGLATFASGASGVLGPSLPVSLAVESSSVLVELLALIAALTSLGMARGEPATEGAPASSAASGIWLAVPAAVWAASIAAALALIAGYLGLARFLTHEAVWAATVLAAVMLLARFFDDLFPALLAPDAVVGRATRLALGTPTDTLRQIAVLLSGAARIALLLLAASTLLAPFGASADDLVSRIGAANLALRLGQVTISPGAILGALALFALGLALTRGVRGWLETRYLPTTRMDLGVRASIASAVTYLGVALAGLLTMGFLGLSFSQVALFAGALSVGIGFGLQAIVGNFLSGLILLAERPVKVGDWIAIGDLEGDVKRINIRATEIEMLDRSKLIVPNTDLVTKTVRNVTADAVAARLRIVLRTAIETDPAAARELILACLRGHAEVLPQPAPSVYLSDVRDGALEFTCFAYVPSARMAYRIKSELLFRIVPEMKAKGIALASIAPVVNIGLPDRLIEPSAAGADPPAPSPQGAAD